MSFHNEHSTIIGTTTGTVFTLFATIDLQDLIKTAILAFVGALVSFLVSWFLKWLAKRKKK